MSGMELLARHISLSRTVPDGSLIFYNEGSITGWQADGKLYIVGDLTPAKQLVNNLGQQWNGETLNGVMHRIIKECGGLPSCQPNPEVRAVFSAAGAKDKAQYGATPLGEPFLSVDGFSPPAAFVSKDINKAHAACMYHPVEDFYGPSIHDCLTHVPESLQLTFTPPPHSWCVCEGLLAGCALFRKGTCLLQRANVVRAREDKIPLRVVAYIKCSMIHDINLFKPILEGFVKASNGDPELYNALVVRLSGTLGKEYYESNRMYVESDPDVFASRFAALSRSHDKVTGAWGLQRDGTMARAPVMTTFSTQVELFPKWLNGANSDPIPPTFLEGTEYMLFGTSTKTQISDVCLHLYHHILDNNNYRLYELEQRLGTVLVRKTDHTIAFPGPREPFPSRVGCNHPDPVVCKAISTWGTYKDADPFNVTKPISPSNMEPPLRIPWVHHRNIFDSDQIAETVELLMREGGALIEGDPGTGKSYLATHVAGRCEDMGLKVGYMAFTNTAALNLGCNKGKTIDRTLYLKRNTDCDDDASVPTCPSTKWLKAAGNVDIYLVDELSLIPGHTLAVLDALRRFHPHLRFLLVGDRHQCQYVEPGVTLEHQTRWPDYFDHPMVMALAGYNQVHLTVNKRSLCAELDRAMLAIKRGVTIGAFRKDIPTGVFETMISFLNETRLRVNKYMNQRDVPKGALHIPHLEVAEDEYEEMYVYPSVRLQCQETKKSPFSKHEKMGEGGVYIANQEIYTITQVAKGAVVMETKRKFQSDRDMAIITHTVSVPQCELRRFFRLGYCVTTHSAQGATFTENFTLWDTKLMPKKVLYTAVGRARRFAQVHLPPPELRHLEERDTNLEKAHLTFIKSKIKGYRDQDKRRGLKHAKEDYPIASKVLKDLHEVDFCCQRCEQRMGMRKNIDLEHPNPRQMTFQRLNNKLGHVFGNVAYYCHLCNIQRPERSHLQPEDTE